LICEERDVIREVREVPAKWYTMNPAKKTSAAERRLTYLVEPQLEQRGLGHVLGHRPAIAAIDMRKRNLPTACA
jgi:hypothetical protein